MRRTESDSTPMSGDQFSSVSASAYKRQSIREPILFALLVVDFVLFASGSLAHIGIPIPLGFATWIEPFVLPAAIVEGVGALVLGVVLVSLLLGAAGSRNWVWGALWLCFAATLWGMAVGAIMGGGTVSNDFLHIAMILVTTLALVRLASLGNRREAPHQVVNGPQSTEIMSHDSSKVAG